MTAAPFRGHMTTSVKDSKQIWCAHIYWGKIANFSHWIRITKYGLVKVAGWNFCPYCGKKKPQTNEMRRG